MGYQVYEDEAARDLGVIRWAGYGVPAVCDTPACEAEIDRGMGYRCQQVYQYRYFENGVEVDSDANWDDEIEEEGEGCGLHFCDAHLSDHALHAGLAPKPDTAEWERWVLADESWQQWRDENAERVADMRIRVAGS